MGQITALRKWNRWLYGCVVFLWATFAWLGMGFAAMAADPLPGLKGDIYVQDMTNTLSPSTVEKIRYIGGLLEDKTKAQVVTAVVGDIPNGDMESYATDLFRHWGIGDKNENNGVLLVVSPTQHKVRIEVGYGLEGAINDAKAGRILDRDFIPAAKEGDYDKAVLTTYLAIVGVVMEEYGITAKDLGTPGVVSKVDRSDYWETLPAWVKMLLFLGVICLLYMDWKYNHGLLTIALLRAISRGGSGGGGGFRGGGGGSSGGGGASRSW